MEEDKGGGMSLWDFFFLLFGIGWLYRAWKGGIWAALWYPVGFFLMIAIFAFIVGSFVLAIVIKLWWLFLIIAIIVFISKNYSSFQSSGSQVEKKKEMLTDEQLDKIYTLAMRDLQNGKISEKRFLRVAERVREYRTINNS